MTNLAILGAGRIARTMASTVRQMERRGDPVRLWAVGARDADRAEAFAREEGARRAYGSYEALVADPQVDLVYIATPHSPHAAHVRLCVEAGKAVLCEKAFTANARQAEEVLRLAEEKGVLVTEAIWPRYMPSRAMIDGLIAEGAIGQVKMLTANLCYPMLEKERLTEPALAGGALLDVGVYALNFASMVLGDRIVRTESSAQLSDKGVDLTDSITYYYESGAVAQLLSGMVCAGDRRGLIYGETGWLSVDNINNPGRIELWRPYDPAPERVLTVPAQLTGYEYEVTACMEALAAGRIECPAMPHAETLEIMRRMDALRAAWGVKYPFE